MNAWRDYNTYKIDVSKEFDADFNFAKIHSMSHWVELICRSRALQQYTAKRYCQLNKINLKGSWNAFNHNLNYMQQVITFQHRIRCLESRELSLKAITECQDNSAAACKVVSSGDYLAAPLSSQSYAKPEFIGPHNRWDRKHPDNMITDFRALLYNTRHAMYHVAIYSVRREFLKHISRKMTYISDDQLHRMVFSIHHGIKVHVEGVEGKRIFHMCRCTGCQSLHGGDRQNEWVWVMQRPGGVLAR